MAFYCLRKSLLPVSVLLVLLVSTSVVEGTASDASAEDDNVLALHLNGTVTIDGESLAIINHAIYKSGDVIAGYEVKSIEPNRVQLGRDGRSLYITVWEEQ